MQQIFSESFTFVRRNINIDNDKKDNDDDINSDQVKKVLLYIFITVWPRPLGLLQLVPIT
jgi:hypothetical protein